MMADGLYSRTNQTFESTTAGQREAVLDPAAVYGYSSSNARLIATAGVKQKGFRFGVGPELSLVLSERETLSELNGFENKTSSLVGGFNFLVGYQIGQHLQLDLKCVKYFESVGSSFEYNGMPLEIKSSPSLFELSLGFYL